MTPINTTLTTDVLGAPAGWEVASNGECAGLPVVTDGRGFSSFWRPSQAELAALNAGGMLQLVIFGGGHPPVALHVTRPDFTPEVCK
jgi:hypothetical protein